MALAAGARSGRRAAATSRLRRRRAPGRRHRNRRQPDSAQFDELVKQATAARQAEQWEDAAALFTKAVKLRPDYAEGYWYQGAAYYQLDKFTECRDAFRRVTKLTPKQWRGVRVSRPLRVRAAKEYDRALQHLVQSRILGVADKDLGSVARYNAAVLMTRVQQFQQALQTLGEFALGWHRQSAHHRGDGHRHAAHGHAAR